MRIQYEVLREKPVKTLLLKLGGGEYATPAIVSRERRGRHVIPGDRVTLAAGEDLAERWSRRVRRLGVGIAVLETVIDFSVYRSKPLVGFSALRELARSVAEECPPGVYCLPPVAVGLREKLEEVYEALNEGYEAGGGVGCSAPLYDEPVLREFADSCEFLVVDAGRRAWSTLGEALSVIREHKGPVYLVNVYRGGGVPRPARELAFFIHGADVLGFSRPTLRQLAVIRARGSRASGAAARGYGLDPNTLEYKPDAPQPEEVLEEVLRRIEESSADDIESLLRELCEDCTWLLEEARVAVAQG